MVKEDLILCSRSRLDLDHNKGTPKSRNKLPWDPWLIGNYETCGRTTVIIREGTVDLIPGRGNRFSLLKSVQTALGPRPILRGRETDQSHASGAGVKNGGVVPPLNMCFHDIVLSCIINVTDLLREFIGSASINTAITQQ
jgi:hypothetical protein